MRAWTREALRRAELASTTRQFLTESMPPLLDHLAFRRFVDSTFSWFADLQGTMEPGSANDENYEEEAMVWRQLQREVENEFGSEGVSLHHLLQELDLRSKTPIPPSGAVPCFTIHASKGMEFAHVYLAALVEDQLPSWAAVKRGDDSHQMQEERRMCFVGITRAQNSLTLTYSSEVFGWSKEPSRFLGEMELLGE